MLLVTLIICKRVLRNVNWLIKNDIRKKIIPLNITCSIEIIYYGVNSGTRLTPFNNLGYQFNKGADVDVDNTSRQSLSNFSQFRWATRQFCQPDVIGLNHFVRDNIKLKRIQQVCNIKKYYLLIWQVFPLHPWRHWHVKLLTPSMHAPPFKHGFGLQSSLSS